MSLPTPLELARAGLGCAELLPGVAGAELGHDLDHRERIVCRVLGGRHLVQALVTATLPVRRLGVAVDVLHGASMAVLAAVGPPRFRRAARVQFTLATVLAVWGASEPRR